MNELWIALIPFALFFAWLFFSGMGCRKACPDCKEVLPIIQSPFTKTKRQWFEGGYLCRNCGCETNLAGEKVASGTGPRLGYVVRSVLLVALPAIAGTAMLFFIKSTLFAPRPLAVAPALAVVLPLAVPAPPPVAPLVAEPGREAPLPIAPLK